MHDQVEAARAFVASAAYYGHSSVRAIVRGHRRGAEERARLRRRLAALGDDLPRRGARRAARVRRPRRGEAGEGGGAAARHPADRRGGRAAPADARARAPARPRPPPARRRADARGLVRPPRRRSPRTRWRGSCTASATAATSSARCSSAAGSARTGAGSDDVGRGYGSTAASGSETTRRTAFERLSDAGRAASAWRHYTTAARAAPERTLELRYEALVADPAAAAEPVAAFLHSDPEPLAEAFARRVRDLGRPLATRPRPSSSSQTSMPRRAPLLRELGYA